MSAIKGKFGPFVERMQAEDLPKIVIETFKYYYTRLVKEESGLIPESNIEPIESLPDAETFSADLAATGQEALSKTVLLKLNGGLGTSMGLERAKSLLTVIKGLTFLDITARQARRVSTPLVLMNSFNTRDDSLAVLKQYPDLLEQNIPLDFLQHKVPKVDQHDLSPADWPQEPELEWCPPGHGDIYTALVTSGMLQAMLKAGYEYMFVSNIDNLGAVIDTTILGYFVQEELPFMMEVADRTGIDKKGGHLARFPDGQLVLRESAQCPPEDMDDFQNINRHKYFNTNNLWISLPALQKALEERDYILGLPMIRNEKTVDPRDENSTPVYQLETAMGSAIGILEGAGAVRVPRTRFAPVKTTEDLLALRSDAYVLTDDYQMIPNPDRELGMLLIELDPDYYKLIDDMEARFPAGPPAMLACERLDVAGDVKFGRDVTLKGRVQLINDSGQQVEVEDQALIKGERRW